MRFDNVCAIRVLTAMGEGTTPESHEDIRHEPVVITKLAPAGLSLESGKDMVQFAGNAYLCKHCGCEYWGPKA